MAFPSPQDVGLETASPSQDSSNNNVSNDQAPESQQTQDQAISQVVYELEKLGKIKFQGEEWTPDSLKKAMLREKDYTRKTQEVAEQRKNFESEEKFYRNLHWDLQAVAKNPELVSKFIQTYPAKFHQYLKEYLSETSKSPDPQSQQQRQPTPDVELMSRLDRMEKVYAEQEIAKNESVIQSTMDRMSKKYPDAIPDLVLARVVEVHDQGTQLTDQVWDQIYKQVDTQMKDFVKARYGDMVKQQKSANEKARDVGSGGGTVGTAPKKFNSFKELNDFSVKDIVNRHRGS